MYTGFSMKMFIFVCSLSKHTVWGAPYTKRGVQSKYFIMITTTLSMY